MKYHDLPTENEDFIVVNCKGGCDRYMILPFSRFQQSIRTAGYNGMVNFMASYVCERCEGQLTMLIESANGAIASA